ncbi:MAG: ABC transporter permease subunit [Pseudobacter sp.]|uniref:ABC transporter permease subunit n=1 Tax=Pseudobacter sp. TaxID=2045420 RepID=UPI003F807134
MKIILKIARAELRNLFYSPIAWLVLILFYFFAAIMFAIPVERYAIVQEVYLEEQPDWVGFAQSLCNLMLNPIIDKVAEHIYLFIPLLTMGVINREISNGTIRLLYSSPVTTREIVLGKYLGLVLFNMMTLAITAVVMVIAYFNIRGAEFQWFFSMFLGFFLLINSFSAIGLFISCLTQYQIVAAVFTFAVLFVLNHISAIWQQYDFFRDITYALSMNGKAGFMLRGLITSRDVIYFVLIIILFLGFALIKLKSTQQPQKWTVNFLKYAGLLVIVSLLGYISSRPGFVAYADVTSNKVNTLHPATQGMLRQLDGSPLTVTLYTNLLGRSSGSGLPQNRNEYVWNFWEPYLRFYPNIKFRYEYYYGLKPGDSSVFRQYPGKTLKQIVDIHAEIFNVRPSLFRPFDEIKNQIDLSQEDMGLTMQVEYKGKKELLRAYKPPGVWPDQVNVSGTLKRLLATEDVVVKFVSGHFERNPLEGSERDYAGHLSSKSGKEALINKGVDVDTISLNAGIPSDTRLLVIADPRSAYTTEEQARISKYIREGGNAIFFAEPLKNFILQPVLDSLGVYLDNGIIVSPNEHEMPHISSNLLTRAGNFMAKEPKMQVFQDYNIMGASVQNEGTGNISFKDTNGFKIEPVIVQAGDHKTWLEKGTLVVDSAAPVFSAAEGDIQKEQYVVAVKLTRKINNKEQRIVVCYDADFMGLRRMVNSSLNLGLYSWGLYNQYPVYANYPKAFDRFLNINSSYAIKQKLVMVYLVPAILILGAIILLVRRKRK